MEPLPIHPHAPPEVRDWARALAYTQTVAPRLWWIKSADGRYLACDPGYARMLHRSVEDFLGHTVADLFGPAAAAHYDAHDRRALLASGPVVEEFWLQGEQRRQRLEVTKTALRDARGQALGLLCTAQEVTHRWQLTQVEQAQSAALQALAQEVPLRQVLSDLVARIETLFPGGVCALGAAEPGREEVGLWVAPSWVSEGLPALDASMAQVCSGNAGVSELDADWELLQGTCLRAVDGTFLGVFLLHHDEPVSQLQENAVVLAKLAHLVQVVLHMELQRRRLADSEQRFRALAEQTPEAVLVHVNTRILYANPAAVRLFGARGAADLVGTSTVERIHPDYLAQQMQRLQRLQARQQLDGPVQSCFLRLDGRPIQVEVQGTPIVYGGQDAIHVSVRDITQRLATEAKLRLSASVFTHAREGIVFTDAQVRIVDVNEAFTRITGYTREEVLGENPRVLASGQHPPEFYAELWRSLLRDGAWSGELWNRRKSGQVYAQLQTITAVRNDQGVVTHYMALFSDVTARKTQEAQLERMAHHDALTGLPNRVLKADRLRQAMVQAQRRGQWVALAYLDLDGFKPINDNHGHAAGDHLLVTLAQRMKQVMREGDTLARVGGDEFAAIIVDLNEPADCEPLLQRLLEAASQPVRFGDARLQVSASIGVTFYPQDRELEPQDLVRQADQAMYAAKQRGKNQKAFYPALNELQ